MKRQRTPALKILKRSMHILFVAVLLTALTITITTVHIYSQEQLNELKRSRDSRHEQRRQEQRRQEQLNELKRSKGSESGTQIKDPSPWRNFFVPKQITQEHVYVVAGTLVGIIIVIRLTIKIRRRKKWQERSEKEKPPETCQPCTYYCRRIELALDPTLRKITRLILGFYDPVSGKLNREISAKGEAVSGLNKVLKACRRGKMQKKLLKHMKPVVRTLLKQIIHRLHREPPGTDVSVVAHLEGGKANFLFILYHCRRRGNVNFWEKEREWEAKIKDENDEIVGTLRNLDPAEARMSMRLDSEITQLLMQFIQRV